MNPNIHRQVLAQILSGSNPWAPAPHHQRSDQEQTDIRKHVPILPRPKQAVAWLATQKQGLVPFLPSPPSQVPLLPSRPTHYSVYTCPYSYTH